MDLQTKSSFQGLKSIMHGLVNRARQQIESIDRRVQRVEKVVGVPTPSESKSGQRDDDSNVSLDARLKSGRDRIDRLEKDVQQIKTYLQNQ